ncbi:hypothetical protein BDN72DRAFT_964524 [Pluteus cervinus]|uniref:Uncharacterized protein n=1 Tax=Pluteus cervinus TaxID=181527 RepID=A0ACD3A9R6_9AGAR|nr:hypothetical protein BDN72DRAFT_964524 [Pluteus cervinus]
MNHNSAPRVSSQHDGRATSLANGKGIIYSPNSKRAVQLPWNGNECDDGPGHTTMYDPRSSTLTKYQQPLWWTDAHGWLSFVPLSPDYQNVPFDCLSGSTYLLADDTGRHSLDRFLVYQWQRLEHFLYWSTSVMMKRISAPAIRPYAPSAYLYDDTFAHHRTARRQTGRARDWFTLWGALFSYLACVGEEQASCTANFTFTRVPHWCEFLPAEGLDCELVRAIQFHQICQVNKAVERAGVFLSLLEPQPNQPPVEWFLERHIPVWYLWTKRESDAALQDPKLARYAPQGVSTEISQPVSPSPSTDSTDIGKPKASPWVQFFEERQIHEERWLLIETPAEREQRLERTHNPLTCNAPVFEWRQNHITAEFERCPVISSERTMILSHYSDDQKAYNSIYNEWDCWPISSEDQHSEDEDIQRLTCPSPNDDDDIEYNPRLYDRDIAAPPTPPPSHTVVSEVNMPQYETAGILSTFYGFQPTSQGTGAIPWSKNTFYRIIGLRTPEGHDFYESDDILAAYEFILDIAHQRRPAAASSDLVQGSQSSLAKRVRPYRLIGGLYVLDFGSQTTREWKLAVTRASDLLVVFRQDPSLNDYEMARKLVGLGIRIKTLLPRPYIPRPPPPCKTFPTSGKPSSVKFAEFAVIS